MSHRTLGLICLLVIGGCGSAPHDLVKSVPKGSMLTDLDRYLHRGAGSTGEVTEWTPAPPQLPGDNEPRVVNGYGNFKERSLGSYDAWNASAEERNRFTGQITFTDVGSTSSDVNTLVYRKGKLVGKDWGFLPG